MGGKRNEKRAHSKARQLSLFGDRYWHLRSPKGERKEQQEEDADKNTQRGEGEKFKRR